MYYINFQVWGTPGSSSADNDTQGFANLIDEADAGFNVGDGQREGHFTGASRVVIPVPLDLRGYTSMSFRTCRYGALLSQVRGPLFSFRNMLLNFLEVGKLFMVVVN